MAGPGGDGATDEDLLAAVAAGDQAAFVTLYDRHSALAFHLARRLLGDNGAAEEVVQDVFLRLWREAATFDPARGAARGWLLSSIHHAAISRTRGRWAHQRRELPLPPPWDARLTASDDPAAAAEAAELAGLVRAGLAALPAAQREAVEWQYYGGLTCVEIAARAAVSVPATKGRLRLGRARLQALLIPLAATD